jgi:hypothetical protein
MAADVLLYNSLNEVNIQLAQESAELTTAIATKAAATGDPLAEIIGNAGPNQANLWCLIPEGSGWTTGLKVCDTTNYKRCNVCCLWTVPAGVTCVRFQLWGAGAGSAFNNCCGYQPFGGTGAYASVIMPVTPGAQYTLCTGCGGLNGNDGGTTFITGTGLTNLCAQGGEGDRYCELVTRCVFTASECQWCMYLGSCICASGSICSGSSGFFKCLEVGFPYISSCKTYFGTATNGSVYGIRGSFGYIKPAAGGTICCAVHPPIYGFASTSCCAMATAQCCGGGICCQACNSVLVVPGAGGFASYTCTGTCICGDYGRFGMICVCYK